MTTTWRGMTAVVLVAAVSAGGLLVLTSASPGAADPSDAAGPTLPAVPAISGSAPTTPGPTTEPPASTTTPTTSTTTSTTTTTTSTTTTTTSTTTTSTTVPVAVATVAASHTIVGAGGSVTFDGTCAAASRLVVVWITRDTDGSVDIVGTGITASPWTYVWTAPSEATDVSSFVFQFWCGDPVVDASAAPIAEQLRIDMVASATATTTPAPSGPVAPSLPETD